MKIDLLKLKSIDYDLEDWLNHFKSNIPLDIDFTLDVSISNKEKEIIIDSINSFAKGEASSGKNLIVAINREKEYTGKATYLEIMKFFIKEENTHSFYLKSFMKKYKIKEKSKGNLDRIFRSLRKLGGIKGEILVLSTAELIALSYYQALGKITKCNSLKRITSRMLQDESHHIVFQSYKLSMMRYTRFTRFFRKSFLFMTATIVWLVYRKFFKASGYLYKSFISECLYHLNESEYIVSYNLEKKIKFER